jgi:putative membrane protein
MLDVAAEHSLNHSMNSALKHYSSLFFLPSFNKAVALIASICIGGVGLSTFFFTLNLSGLLLIDGLARGFFLGLSLLAGILLADYILSDFILKHDPIYILRRTLALSLYSWIVWLFFIILGVILGTFFGVWLWVKLCLLGFAAVLTLRAVVFISTSSAGVLRCLFSSFLQPFLCIAAFVVFWNTLDSVFPIKILPFLVISPAIGYLFASLFVFLIDRLGVRTYGIASMPLFRAFMLNWVAGLNAPLEGFLEKLGENEDVEVSLLKFDSYKPKAAIIVPLVHPGPFKNIGSSLLPSMLKRDFEKEFNCEACVPLGILGHELDLASQAQNKKIIDQVITSARFPAFADKATPFVKVTDGFATASCQIFGKTAFLSFTLAPKTTEDFPQQLGRFVHEEAEKLGLECTVVVNAHNSINDMVDVEAHLSTLREVAFKCLKRAVSLPSCLFEVGTSTVFPQEFSLKDGMGPGGITAIVVKVAEQRTVYIVIDGNNIVSGLREEILSVLKSSGFHEGEVFTTDTHAVSALVLGRRGYHPVGEVMDHKTLFRYIKEVARAASANLERCSAGCLRLVVPKVRVIGEARLKSLSIHVDKALHKAKQTVAPIFAFEGLILVLLLMLL